MAEHSDDASIAACPELDAAIQGIGLSPVLEPIVALPGESVVGYEVLARWPTLNNPRPTEVFAHAAAAEQTDQLDRLCIDAAIKTALAAAIPRGTMVAVNCEPLSTYVGRADNDVLARGHEELALVFELTERGLLTRPHALLAKVAAMRADGFDIALDDVGAHPDSLALLDVISPEIIKLDLALVQFQPTDDQARTLAAVLAYHERTGATILAEGIENDEHLEQALALGASLGQGRKYDDLCPHDKVRSAPSLPWRRGASTPTPTAVSPFDLIAGDLPLRSVRKKTLTAFSHHIESQAGQTADPPIVLTALQHNDYFTVGTRRRYARLARSSPLVAILGQQLPHDLGCGIRGVYLDPGDPLCAEWTVVALGPQLAVALVARELGEFRDRSTEEENRRFEFTITYNRALVTAAAQNLLDRML